MTKKEFKNQYYKSLSKEEIDEYERDFTVIQCNCKESNCNGWQMITKKGLEMDKKALKNYLK